MPVGLFPGYDLAAPVSEPYVPERPAPPTIRESQQLLVDLGFMAPDRDHRLARRADLDRSPRLREVGGALP